MFNKILHKLFGVRLISSQCGEDLIIESMLPAKKDGFFVDVGANHPIKYSNTFLFYCKGWRGLNIEPDPSRLPWFKLFRHRDINLNIGVGLESGELIFNVFNENTLSTFDEASAKEFEKIGHKINKKIVVPIRPLKTILEQYAANQEIDLLSIDTEGFDLLVLKSNDWDKFRPTFVILETLEYRAGDTGKKLNDIFDPYMAEIGYGKVADTHINTIYKKLT